MPASVLLVAGRARQDMLEIKKTAVHPVWGYDLKALKLL